MTLDTIRRLCLSLPGVTEDITWSAQPSAGLSVRPRRFRG
jgi:predicted DNA-binding protein (MmcQ/YjbR family)